MDQYRQHSEIQPIDVINSNFIGGSALEPNIERMVSFTSEEGCEYLLQRSSSDNQGGHEATREHNLERKGKGKELYDQVFYDDVEVNVEDLREKLAQKVNQRTAFSSTKGLCAIHRVLPSVRERHEEDYTPKTISIGPLHHANKKLEPMQHLKWVYLDDFLNRSSHPDQQLKICTDIVTALKVPARKMYVDEVGLDSREFIEMMLLDGCFIIEFMIKHFEEDQMQRQLEAVNWSVSLIYSDLLLLENQIPFLILHKLFSASEFDAHIPRKPLPSLIKLVLYYLNKDKVDSPLKDENPENVHHLLHLFHLSILLINKNLSIPPTPNTNKNLSNLSIPSIPNTNENLSNLSIPSTPNTENSLLSIPPTPNNENLSENLSIPRTSNNENLSIPPTTINMSLQVVGTNLKKTKNKMKKRCILATVISFLLWWLLSLLTCRILRPRSWSTGDREKIPQTPRVILNATEPDARGVRFKKRETDGSFLEVTFEPENGVMMIPALTIIEGTAALFRNLIAFEQCYHLSGNYFIEFAELMDSLIDTPQDVVILKRCGIIENKFGDDKQVADLFNSLRRGAVLRRNEGNHYLEKVLNDVKRYSEIDSNKWRARLMEDYFGSPWTTISVIAAVILLVLTVLQTFYTIYPYYHPIN